MPKKQNKTSVCLLKGGYRIKVNRAEIWRTAEERGTTYPRGWLNMIHQPSCGFMRRGRGEGEADKAFPSLTQCTPGPGSAAQQVWPTS